MLSVELRLIAQLRRAGVLMSHDGEEKSRCAGEDPQTKKNEEATDSNSEEGMRR